jgi:hypothetical protein
MLIGADAFYKVDDRPRSTISRISGSLRHVEYLDMLKEGAMHGTRGDMRLKKLYLLRATGIVSLPKIPYHTARLIHMHTKRNRRNHSYQAPNCNTNVNTYMSREFLSHHKQVPFFKNVRHYSPFNKVILSSTLEVI